MLMFKQNTTDGNEKNVCM